MTPFLVTTEIAAMFVVKCRNLDIDEVNLKSARKHIYNLASTGKITRHGGPKRGCALWDLHELAKGYRQVTIVGVP